MAAIGLQHRDVRHMTLIRLPQQHAAPAHPGIVGERGGGKGMLPLDAARPVAPSLTPMSRVFDIGFRMVPVISRRAEKFIK